MKNVLLLVCITLISLHELSAQSVLELPPYQSMSITGKGPGQDAAINPYAKVKSYAIVENIGKNEFSIRVQKSGEIIEQLPIKAGTIKKVKLLVGYELYLDSELEGKATVDFEKMDK